MNSFLIFCVFMLSLVFLPVNAFSMIAWALLLTGMVVAALEEECRR